MGAYRAYAPYRRRPRSGAEVIRIILLVLLAVNDYAQAQSILIDPSQRCAYVGGSNQCQPIRPQPPQYQYQPIPGGGNTCAGQCLTDQNMCNRGCQGQPDFYSCFSQCGEQHTLCIQRC
jgi:hypothetical protein